MNIPVTIKQCIRVSKSLYIWQKNCTNKTKKKHFWNKININYMLFLHIGEGFCLQPFPPNDSVSSLFVYFSGSVGIALWWTPKGKFLEFMSTDCCKMHFSWNFKVSLGVLKNWIKWKIFQGFSKNIKIK